ncbi:MAG: GNAT family N-acetyltransferase [Verrucomicrobiaceae bacterium]|nr:MAG: GNAT family N-acetyltransferase [Verrucomicrobiaceae bacterium]
MTESNDGQFRIEKIWSYDNHFIDSYLRLFSDCFGVRQGYNSKWFHWFNSEAPFGKNKIYCAIDNDNGKLASAYGLLPLQAVYCGATKSCFLNTNSMTAPEYQRRGLSSQISEYAVANEMSDFILATPNSINTISIKNIKRVLGEPIESLQFLQKTSFQYKIKANRDIVNITADNIHNLQFNDEMWKKYNFHIRKDAQLFKWRYFNNPIFAYKFSAVVKDGAVVAYIVYKMFFDAENNIRKVHLVDFAYMNDDSIFRLIQDAECYALEEKANLVNVWCHGMCENDKNMFESIGYRIADGGNVCFIHPSMNLLERKNWHFVLGDNDVF